MSHSEKVSQLYPKAVGVDLFASCEHHTGLRELTFLILLEKTYLSLDQVIQHIKGDIPLTFKMPGSHFVWTWFLMENSTFISLSSFLIYQFQFCEIYALFVPLLFRYNASQHRWYLIFSFYFTRTSMKLLFNEVSWGRRDSRIFYLLNSALVTILSSPHSVFTVLLALLWVFSIKNCKHVSPIDFKDPN